MASIVLKGGNTCLKIKSEAFRISCISQRNLTRSEDFIHFGIKLMDDSCGMNAVGEPYEGKPHVRFDEGLVETQFGWAPPVYSTAWSEWFVEPEVNPKGRV